MSKDLKTLYSVFDLLNGEDISHSPSMSNPSNYDFNGILTHIQRVRDGKEYLNSLGLDTMKTLLKETNYCYYQPSELRPPVRINNCPYIEICNKLMEES